MRCGVLYPCDTSAKVETMGFLILVVVGSILGWLASIITRVEDRQGILLNCVIGCIGAVAIGMLTNKGSILLGISGQSLLAAFLGTAVLLGLAYFIRRRTVSGD